MKKLKNLYQHHFDMTPMQIIRSNRHTSYIPAWIFDWINSLSKTTWVICISEIWGHICSMSACDSFWIQVFHSWKCLSPVKTYQAKTEKLHFSFPRTLQWCLLPIYNMSGLFLACTNLLWKWSYFEKSHYDPHELTEVLKIFQIIIQLLFQSAHWSVINLF